MSTLHVTVDGDDTGDGSTQRPLRTISYAAEIAVPGDVVRVHAGEYREWVKPARGGRDDRLRITYEAAPGEHVVIKGSERVDTWRRESGSVWRAEVPNALFGEWNPYQREVEGDWLVRSGDDGSPRHLGEVYLNGVAFYETDGLEQVKEPSRRTTVVDDRTGQVRPIPDPDGTRYVWWAEVGADTTTIWANFQDADPNVELTEINVRRSVFQPEKTNVDYVTVRGFELAHAATPWAPPTADQPGLIGPNWAKGWIIEDNLIHHAKCSAISLGKEQSTGDNDFTRRRDKPGYQYQLESVFSARNYAGWTKERIGSHIVRNNTIHDCGQNAIVGNLGCAFSRISGNTIYRIAEKRDFYGHEIGGIKLHAAIDVEIEHNHIHDCALGIWLDWQTQGTRVTRNVMHHNCRDLYVEVSHGPYVVDHNVFASPAAIESMSDGGAYIKNLVGGTFLVEPVMDRATPYHAPHSTEVTGFAVAYGGDDRVIGNIFVGPDRVGAEAESPYPAGTGEAAVWGYGSEVYDGHPSSAEEYLDEVKRQLPGDLGIFLGLRNPVYISDNVYLAGARAYAEERDACAADRDGGTDLAVRLSDDGAAWLTITLPEDAARHRVPPLTSADLERVRMLGLPFEGADGRPIAFDTDLLGARSEAESAAGPIGSLQAGANEIRVW